MVPDRLGGKAQEVDILIEEPAGQITLQIGVEVRDRSRAADVGWVQEMRGKHEHRTDKLILVSRTGFTKNALNEAEKFGIETMDLQEAIESDWAGKVSKLKEVFLGRFNVNIVKCRAVLAEEYGHPEEPEVGLGEPLYSKDDEKAGPVGELAEQVLRRPESGKNLMDFFYANQDRSRATAMFELVPGCYLIDTYGTKWRVRAIKVEIECDLRMTPIPLQHGLVGTAHVSWGETTVGDEQLFMVNTEQPGQPERTTLRIAQGTHQTEQLIHMEDATKP